MPPRSRPRVNHVRTGCITCKNRRVKCSEERPYCSRCTRGGFLCAGYQPPPKAWIFHGSTEAQKHADKTRSEFYSNCLPADSRDLATRTITSQNPAILPRVLVRSPLQNGNSDPFNSYAVPIGPRETEILQVFKRFVAPPRPSKLINAVVHEIKQSYLAGLGDQATAYALFARDIVFESLMREGHHVALSTSSLDYVVRSQAALRRRLLSLTNGSETPHTAYTVMWTATYLAATDIITGASTAQFHIQALRKLVARYAELVGDNLETIAISSLIHIDNVKAFVTSTRPVLNPYHWSQYLFQDTQDAGPISQENGTGKDLPTDTVHRAVRDETLKTAIINQRQGLALYRDLLGADLGDKKAKGLRVAVRGRELFRHSQLLHVLADALERLSTPELSSEQLQNQSARVYLSFSIYLWSQLASTTSITLYIPFDIASITLHRLKSILMKSRLDEVLCPRPKKPYAEARLWASFVGICTELSRQEILGSDLVCGDWFFETFRDEANSMRVYSWQHAVTIFEQFLHSEKVGPHISLWWHRVSPNDILVHGDDKPPGVSLSRDQQEQMNAHRTC